MTFLWVIIYLVAGFGAYWIICQEGHYIRNLIANKFGDNADDVYADYYRKTQIIPKHHSAFVTVLLAIIALVGVWIFWPFVAGIGGIYNWLMYKHVDKIWSKKLELN